IREHGPEALALAPLDLVEPEVAGLAFPPRAIPFGEKRFLGAAGFAPAPAVAHGGVAPRHRPTSHSRPAPPPPRHAPLRVGEFDALGPNPAVAADDPALAIHQRHGMGRPRQIIPGAVPRRSDAADAPAAPTARIPPWPRRSICTRSRLVLS